MNVVVQTATSVQRRSDVVGAGSTAAILGKPPPQRRNGPRAVSYEGDGEVGRDEYRPRRAPALSPVRVNSRPYTESVETATGTVYRLDRGYVAVSGPEAGGVPRADGLERGRLARAGRGAARAAADAEEPDRRAAARRARRAGGVSADHRGRAGRDGRLDAAASPLRGEVRDRARAVSRLPAARRGRGDPQRGLRRRGVRELGRGASARPPTPDEQLERLRIEAGTPVWGRELDETILPAEAGLDETHVSFTKGCYPGQEPIARLHYRGRPNRRLRVLEVEDAEPGDEIFLGEKAVGRVTSAVPGRRARLRQARGRRRRGARDRRRGRAATLGHPAPVAQGIERCPAEAEVASSNLAGRIASPFGRRRVRWGQDGPESHS